MSLMRWAIAHLMVFAIGEASAQAVDVSRLLRENQPRHSLIMPEPGVSVDGALAGFSRTTLESAISAANRGDWSKAIDDLRAVRSFGAAYCAPSLHYNVGLAYQKSGRLMQSAIWYAAYLTAVPQAGNAERVREELRRLKRDIKARADYYFDAAEQLAAALSDAPPLDNPQSLREKMYEQMVRYYAAFELKEREHLALARLQALRGFESAKSARFVHSGVSMRALLTTLRVDVEAARNLSSTWGLAPETLKATMARLHARAGQPQEASKFFAERSRIDNISPSSLLLTELLYARAYDAFGSWAHAVLANLDRWDGPAFKALVEYVRLVFWDGRPDIGVRIAAQLKNYFDRHGKGVEKYEDRKLYFLVLAMLGHVADLEAIGRGPYDWDLQDNWVIDEMALLLAAVRPASDAPRTISLVQRLWDNYYVAHGGRSEFKPPGSRFYNHEVDFKAGSLAIALLKRDTTKVNFLTENFNNRHAGSHIEHPSAQLVLQFAVLTGRLDLALKATRFATSTFSFNMYPSEPMILPDRPPLYQLRRIPASQRSQSIQSRIEEIERSTCAGWRPRDNAHAHAVWLALRRAYWTEVDAGESGYDDYSSADISRMAKEEPESLPKKLFDKGVSLMLGLNYIVHVQP